MNLLAAFDKPRAGSPQRMVPLTLPILRKNYSPANVYVIPRVREAPSGAVVHLDRVLGRYQRAALIGDAGVGKTSALNFLAAQGVPSGISLHSLSDYHPRALPENFENSKLILLDDVQPSHSDYISRLAREFPQASIILSSPSTASLPPEFPPLMLQPFHEREQTSAVEAWFPSGNARGHGGRFNLREAQAFWTAVKANPGTRLLAFNTLDLFLLLQVYVPGQPLPGRRAELFDTYLRAHLQSAPYVPSSARARADRAEDPDFAARALEGIALSTQRGQIAQDEHLSRGYGFLRPRPSGRVEFVHDMVRHFLAARALRRNPELAPLAEHLEDENWSQVILFYAGLGDPRPVVEALLERGQFDLAARALGQAAEVPDDLHKRVAETLIPRAWEQDDANALAGLAAMQSKLATDFFAARLKERDPAARTRAAKSLGQLHNDRAAEALLPQLRDTNADVRVQVVAALGASQNTRVLEPLLVALRGDARGGPVDTPMRASAARALGELGAEKALPALIVDLQGEPEVRAAVTQALIQIRSDFSRKPLQALIDSNQPAEVRAAAEQVLQSM